MSDTKIITQAPVARAGLFFKGVVYLLLGILAFRAAFHLGGESVRHADKAGVFDLVYRQNGGRFMLAVIAAGLICYCYWRLIEAFSNRKIHSDPTRGLARSGRYLISGLIYGSLAVYAFRMLLFKEHGTGDSRQGLVQALMEQSHGQALVLIAATILSGVGLYQIYYGLSEKYRKHVYRAGYSESAPYLLVTGKIGYVSRGVVWMIIAWLFYKAAIHANPAEAGDTGKAFEFLQETTYGAYLIAAVGVGLICYGGFNFVRARYDHFS